ncbi:MAG: DUF4197 domain-containing protein [Azonexus sp.]|nr:DUF4197 domain-containing protein [Azonexus sp.]
MRHVLAVFVVAAVLTSAPADSQSLGDRAKSLLGSKQQNSGSLTESQAGAGLKEALAQGAGNAVARLGKTDGFLLDEAVRIGTPKSVRKLTKAARKLGAGAQVDAFETSMNRAAEQAIPAAADILSDAVRAMTVEDALAIVRGGDTAGTAYFRRTSEDSLRAAFLPIVSKSTDSNGVTQSFKAVTRSAGGGMAGSLASMAGVDSNLDLDQYVTDKALDGLFHYIAEEEKAIRSNPLKRGSDLLKKAFGG